MHSYTHEGQPVAYLRVRLTIITCAVAAVDVQLVLEGRDPHPTYAAQAGGRSRASRNRQSTCQAS
eukprot:23841-Eustigmatos_ZCMA.PRE.1